MPPMPTWPLWLKPVTLNGETRTLQTWTKRARIPKAIIQKRIEDGWSATQALTTPDDQGRCLRLRPSPVSLPEECELIEDVLSGHSINLLRELAENPRTRHPRTRLPRRILYQVEQFRRRNQDLLYEYAPFLKDNCPTAEMPYVGTSAEWLAVMALLAEDEIADALETMGDRAAYLRNPPPSEPPRSDGFQSAGGTEPCFQLFDDPFVRRLLLDSPVEEPLLGAYLAWFRREVEELLTELACASMGVLLPLLPASHASEEGDDALQLLQRAGADGDNGYEELIELWYPLLKGGPAADGLRVIGQVLGWEGDPVKRVLTLSGKDDGVIEAFCQTINLLHAAGIARWSLSTHTQSSLPA